MPTKPMSQKMTARAAEAAAALIMDPPPHHAPRTIPTRRPRKAAEVLPPEEFARKSFTTLTSPKAEVPAQIRYRAKTEEELMASVPRRLPQMMRQYWGFDPMPFHIADIERLFRANPAPGRLGRLRPTEHGKSTGALVVYPILSLANDPNAAHIQVCSNRTEASRWIYEIEMFLESNEDFIRDYPWCAKPTRQSSKKWNTQELTVAGRDSNTNNPNPSVYATGRGDKSIKSRRGKTVFDDLEGLGTVTEIEREKLWSWLTNEGIRTMEDGDVRDRPLWLVQGTPFDVDSIYYRLEEIAGIEVSMLPYKYPEGHPKAGRLIWPAKANKIAEFRSLRDPRIFAIAMELNPKVGREETFSYKEVLSMGDARQPTRWSDARIFVSLDPASGSKVKGADYAGISVTRIRWPRYKDVPRAAPRTGLLLDNSEPPAPEYLEPELLPEVELLYADPFRMGLYEQVHRCAYLANYYHCPVIVEGNSQQKTSYSEVFAHTHPEVQIIDFQSTAEKKRDTILGLSVIKTLYRTGRFHTVEPAGLDSDPGMQAFRREVRDLETNKHNHIASSVWFVIRHVYEGPRAGPSTVRATGPRAPVGMFGVRNLTQRVDMRGGRARFG